MEIGLESSRMKETESLTSLLISHSENGHQSDENVDEVQFQSDGFS